MSESFSRHLVDPELLPMLDAFPTAVLTEAMLPGMRLLAQGSLQFNKIKLVTTTETVPAGKVWKVESALGPAIGANCSNNPMHTLVVNSWTVNVGTSGNLSYNNYCGGWQGIGIVTSLPIWLPENTTLAAGSNVNAVSVIEFNVVATP